MFSTHSPLDLVSSTFLDEAFGDEVPHNPTAIPTPHITSQQLTHSQRKRKLRSQDARQRRQSRRIQRQARPEESIVVGFHISQIHSPVVVRAPPEGSTTQSLPTEKHRRFPHKTTGSQGIHAAILLRNSQFVTAANSEENANFSQAEETLIAQQIRTHHNSTSTPAFTATHITDSYNPNCLQDQSSNSSSNREQGATCHSTHCPQSQSSSSSSREQWEQQRDMATRLHTRANWFKERIQQPSREGRVKPSSPTPQHSQRWIGRFMVVAPPAQCAWMSLAQATTFVAWPVVTCSMPYVWARWPFMVLPWTLIRYPSESKLNLSRRSSPDDASPDVASSITPCTYLTTPQPDEDSPNFMSPESSFPWWPVEQGPTSNVPLSLACPVARCQMSPKPSPQRTIACQTCGWQDRSVS